MPDLLLELLSEEIPARMQARASEDLRKRITDAIVASGLVYEGAKAFATPRRLALTVHGIPARSADAVEERKGPRVGAPEAAIQGFLKGAGLASLDQATIESDPKKGDFYVAKTRKPGRPTLDILAEVIGDTVKGFAWPKSMRWGAASAEPGALTWVRPLTSIVATFGPETEEPEIVPVSVPGVPVGDVTRGHRFMAPATIRVKRFEDYVAKLEAAKVVLDPERRKAMILHDAKALCMANGLDLVEDQGLLDEVAGLVEWPVVLLGTFEEAFLDIPAEVIRATIRANQKCFVTKRQDGGLANRFVLVSNLVASDGGKAIAAGNGRVVRARLSDARYFWETDRKTKLETRLPKFNNIVFHEKLGTQGERIRRLEALAREVAPLVGADPDMAARAARLSKADLLTEVVGEFPEVQGLMGRRYAALEGEAPEIAAAIEEHYKPVGPSDSVPTAPVSIAVALADKLDMLAGFWSIDEKPTGSKDPYALRRAALGVIRIVLENRLTLNVERLLIKWIQTFCEHGALYVLKNYTSDMRFKTLLEEFEKNDGIYGGLWRKLPVANIIDFEEVARDVIVELEDDSFSESGLALNIVHDRINALDSFFAKKAFSSAVILESEEIKITTSTADPNDAIAALVFERAGWRLAANLIPFLHDRLKVQLRDQGARHDLVDAVLGTGAGDDLLDVVRRVEALSAFLGNADGAALLAGVKRASNILRIEEKKDGRAYAGTVEASRVAAPEERALHAALDTAAEKAKSLVAKADYAGAMSAMAALRPTVDAFFEAILVNDPDSAIRANRLELLASLRATSALVADFGRVEG